MTISPVGPLKFIVSVFVSHITDKIGHNPSALKEIHSETCLKKIKQQHDLECKYALKHSEETDHWLGAKAFPAYHGNTYLTSL